MYNKCTTYETRDVQDHGNYNVEHGLMQKTVNYKK